VDCNHTPIKYSANNEENMKIAKGDGLIFPQFRGPLTCDNRRRFEC
jgi:hypothetical protein